MMFAAIPGTQRDGRDFIAEAVTRGAACILVPQNTVWPANVDIRPMIEVVEPRQALARLAAIMAGPMPGHIAAVTGTNGKTSTVDFLRQIWAFAKLLAASLGTLGVIAPGRNGGAGLTTPDPVMLASTLAGLAREGVQHVALEASSHGLDQFRLDGVAVEIAGFSNLTRDHLDYHGTVENYRAAKLRLFTELLVAGGGAAINADMDAETFAALRAIAVERHLRLQIVGENGQDWRLLKATPLAHGQVLQIAMHGAAHEIEINLPGRFQADNVLLAAAMASFEDGINVLAALPHLRGVRGRMELAVTLANGAAAYVDYAHTPDALARLLAALRPHASGRLICVFGAGGDRDAGKRPLMGAVAAQSADICIVTDDNPRGEDPAKIRAAICAAAPGAVEIADRRAAIAAGLEMLRAGDVLVVAGKGHEQGQIIGATTLAFDDAGVMRELAVAA
jgi:UDP-N-acetylmuramoyl-L-alanyl-D-glutamate--2,6-diaminopimelate ligase